MRHDVKVREMQREMKRAREEDRRDEWRSKMPKAFLTGFSWHGKDMQLNLSVLDQPARVQFKLAKLSSMSQAFNCLSLQFKVMAEESILAGYETQIIPSEQQRDKLLVNSKQLDIVDMGTPIMSTKQKNVTNMAQKSRTPYICVVNKCGHLGHHQEPLDLRVRPRAAYNWSSSYSRNGRSAYNCTTEKLCGAIKKYG